MAHEAGQARQELEKWANAVSWRWGKSRTTGKPLHAVAMRDSQLSQDGSVGDEQCRYWTMQKMRKKSGDGREHGAPPK
jgi:hypothetical protein